MMGLSRVLIYKPSSWAAEVGESAWATWGTLLYTHRKNKSRKRNPQEMMLHNASEPRLG